MSLRQEWLAAKRQRVEYQKTVYRPTAARRRRRLITFLAVTLFLLGSVVTAYSPLMALRTINLTGNSRVSTEEITTALSGEIGKPLALVDSEAIKDKLRQFKALKSIAIEASPPNSILIRVSERTPVLFVKAGMVYHLLDEDGVLLEVSSQPPAGLVEADMADSPEVISAIGWVAANLSEEVRKRVDSISAAAASTITLKLDNGRREVFWGDESKSQLKSRVLDVLLSADGSYTTFNVSAPEAPAVK